MRKSLFRHRLSFNYLIIIVFVAFNFSSCQPKNSNTNRFVNLKYKVPIVESQKHLRDYLLPSFTPGISISVSLDNEIIWSEGAGWASKELDVPVNRNTKFRIGTTTQMFTTYLLAVMHEEGALNLDSSFYHYIPEYPAKDFDFTLNMLGTHSAGLPETKATNLMRYREVRTLREFVDTFKDEKLIYQPDTYFLISDYGTALLGIVAEQVAGKKYIDLLKEKVLIPMGLENTMIDNPAFITPNRSNFYTLDFIARLINAPDINLVPLAPVHGLLSTADDLNLAAQLIIETGFFAPETFERITQKHRLSSDREINQGFGWLVTNDKRGRKVLAQIGNTLGGSSVVVVYPEQKLVVTMCANRGDEVDELPANAVAQIFLDYIDKEAEIIMEEEEEDFE